MNVFEDLIEELRDENLLEETVIDVSRAASLARDPIETLESQGPVIDTPSELHVQNPEPGSTLEPEVERDFYRKRAIDEVSSLQMVEHVLSGIEREHMKTVPASYDDLEAKKALHKFVQVQGDSTTTEYAEAEFKLMHETEAWSSALADRDRKIAASHLRRFCENSRPALSSQALMALGRFYRNASYSELSRAKFDLVMTRLFSRDSGEEKRRLLFGRFEMIGHIKTLYANWASIALYSTEDNSLKTRALVAGFEDRIAEAESAETFEQLIRDSYFDKIHEFKAATGEMFFTPEIVAATIDCNTKIGNKFVDLIRVERERTGPETVEQKYGYEYDQIISEAAGKTFHLVELLKNLPDPDDVETVTAYKPEPKPAKAAAHRESKKARLLTSDSFKVNKWLLVAAILAVVASSALFFWSNQTSNDSATAEDASDVELSSSGFGEYARTGRSTSETLYAITLPSWDQLNDEKKREVLRKAQEFAKQQGLKNVQLVNVRGDLEAFASPVRAEVRHPAK
jgi:hypothetical protein